MFAAMMRTRVVCANPWAASVPTTRAIADTLCVANLLCEKNFPILRETSSQNVSGQHRQKKSKGKPRMNGNTEWVPVRFDGKDGWVRSKYLRLQPPQ